VGKWGVLAVIQRNVAGRKRTGYSYDKKGVGQIVWVREFQSTVVVVQIVRETRHAGQNVCATSVQNFVVLVDMERFDIVDKGLKFC
jgi:hypothetical protein